MLKGKTRAVELWSVWGTDMDDVSPDDRFLIESHDGQFFARLKGIK